MQTAKRLYLYLMSGVGLGVLLAGIARFLGWGFAELGVRPIGGTMYLPSAREQLSLAGALLIVGALVWGAHWWFAQRSVRADRPGASVEQQAGLRSFYFAAILAVTVVWAAMSAFELVKQGVHAVVGRPEYAWFDPAAAWAGLITAGAAFAYHAWTRIGDGRKVELHGAAAWWTRLYRYVAAFAGGALVLLGGIWLIQTATGLAFASISTSPRFGWPEILASPIAMVVVGFTLWLGHATYSARRQGERGTRLRMTYLAAALAGGLAGTIVYLGRAVAVPVASALGVERLVIADVLIGGRNDALAAVIVGVVGALAFAGVAWLHRRTLHAEGAVADDLAQMTTARRADATITALVGLAYAAVAGARLIGVAIAVVAGGATFAGGSDGPRHVLAEFLPVALVATPVWLWGWVRMERRRAAMPEDEARSTVRRSALLVVLAAAILSGISSLAVVLYRAFDMLLGGFAANLLVELSTPIAVVVVALVVVAYHGVSLRRDLQLAGGRLLAPATEATWPDAVELVLVGPPDHLPEAVEELRHAVLPGYRLDAVSRPHPLRPALGPEGA
jgi:hypothetical protein